MMFLLDELDEVVHHSVVKVFASQVGVPSCGHHLKDAVVNGQDGDVKGSTAQVKHQNVVLTTLLVQAVGNGCSCGLIDDALNSQTGDDSGILCGLALSIIEVCRNSDDGMFDRLAKICLCKANTSCEMVSTGARACCQRQCKRNIGYVTCARVGACNAMRIGLHACLLFMLEHCWNELRWM